jgi:hypothetical protein
MGIHPLAGSVAFVYQSESLPWVARLPAVLLQCLPVSLVAAALDAPQLGHTETRRVHIPTKMYRER